jgi:hypothetical protein
VTAEKVAAKKMTAEDRNIRLPWTSVMPKSPVVSRDIFVGYPTSKPGFEKVNICRNQRDIHISAAQQVLGDQI